MKFSILIPHWKNGKATAYCVSQLLKHKGSHDIEIIVIDNSYGDGSTIYLRPFADEIKYLIYPSDKLQSHGLAFEYALQGGYVNNEWFITMESDSFPTDEKWLDYIEDKIFNQYDCGGSLLRLSGGCYMHPCAAFYNKWDWYGATEYCKEMQYSYFPGIAKKEGLVAHLMVHESILDLFLDSPEDYIELADSYKPHSRELAMKQLNHYLPVAKGSFHNGMGRLQESFRTYGWRNPDTEVSNKLLDNRAKIIYRAGEEPGQWLHYYLLAIGKKCFYIPTETKWMPGREMQQQEYTKTENGVIHLWAGSSFLSMKDTAMHDVYEFKKNQIDELYNSLPENLKINL
jgi:hypothetical protein